ncbi:SDR family NAD(P)-dependent oxidoreductase [Microbulbifer sp. 2205BS26-8]|uniref:SDR family NAD(P)-dependent oxidoreductase n=1 Tax=Microbulbifer sp. 2205BS26-8 TaxID=3064386 RepID=UPI00273F2DDB|nr:SDR family oxidoreductase [Microbulbifer sp. 2205BS26-8]MDP5209253.1 SDR family oxidoreductase [Microbulbifer sp. 2205BS26-8]
MKTQEFPSGAALIYGGSGGLGSSCAKHIAIYGSDIAITYKSSIEKACQFSEQIKSMGRQCSIHRADVSDAASIKSAFDSAVKTHNRVHTVVVAAGSDIAQPFFSDITDQQWEEVINNDLNGFYRIAKTAIPHMRAQGGGSFVHISSAGLIRTPPKDALSVAPKAGIEAIMQHIAKEEGVHNIRANSVAIGVIEAGIYLRLEKEGIFDEQWKQAVKASLCLKRFGKARDVGEAAAYFASNRANYVTGQMICVDGGYSV